MPKAQRYRDDFVEVLKEGDSLVVKDLTTKRIVQAPASYGADIKFEEVEPAVKTGPFIVYLGASSFLIPLSIALGIEGAQSVDVTQLGWRSFLLLVGYSSFQIILHELAHFLVFRAMERTPDKVGFKLNYYVFPAFYVRMNDAHLLTRRDRYVVHTAGIFINSLVTSFAFLTLYFGSLGQDWLFAFSWYSISMAYNCIPILNSDGFKAFLSLTGNRETRHFKDNNKMVKIIIIISCVAAFLFTLRIVSLFIDGIMRLAQ